MWNDHNLFYVLLLYGYTTETVPLECYLGLHCGEYSTLASRQKHSEFMWVLFVCVAFLQEIVVPQYKDTHIGLTGDSKLAVDVATWYIKSLTFWDPSHH